MPAKGVSRGGGIGHAISRLSMSVNQSSHELQERAVRSDAIVHHELQERAVRSDAIFSADHLDHPYNIFFVSGMAEVRKYQESQRCMKHRMYQETTKKCRKEQRTMMTEGNKG